MLTRKQHELLTFIDKHLKESGVSPSFEEMKDGLNLRSKSGIHRLITALEERGFLRRHHHRARALEVMRLPENISAQPGRRPKGETIAATRPNLAANVIKGDFSGRLAGARAANDVAAVSLPLYGRIAAGQPIEAIRDDSPQIEVPASMLGAGDHFALEVSGDSMIDAGIWDGDTVIVRRGENAETGQIIVALVDENEVTLKRLRRRGNSVALEPANPRHETRLFPPHRVKVQGKLVGLLRRY